MKTFLKIALALVLVLAVLKFWPVLVAPAVVGALLVVVLGGVLAGGLALAVTIGAGLLAGLLGVLLGVVALLSPIWIPVLAIVGFVAILRRLNRKPSVPAAPAGA
jgi:hypothetical protein